MIPELTLSGRRLASIPAIHNRAVFADAVHRACRDDVNRPNAIAVELGPGAVKAVAAWFRDLFGERNVTMELPCMLGLVRRNHLIHPKHRAAVIRLQEEYGLPLAELPVSILWEHAGFANLSLLCLSPTDSMIEAIRSAVELGIPVFGVDLESCAHADRSRALIEDPLSAGANLSGYVDRNAPRCSQTGDRWVDGRREEVMASRLRLLMERYDHVVFTGGLGHWQRLRQRLVDPKLRPAAAFPEGDADAYLRVLVDPIMAVRDMDVFPEISARYEVLRRQPLDSRDARLMYQGLLRDKLAVADRVAERHERDRLIAFAQYLGNLCLVNQRQVPEVIDTVNAADAMVSSSFARRFGEELISKSIPWASREQHPDLPYLRAESLHPSEGKFSAPGTRARLVASNVQSPSFFVQRMRPEHDQRLPVNMESPFPPDAGENNPGPASSQHWVWPPCEHLLFGTGCQAIAEVITSAEGRRVEPFSGSLHEGVDSKATLRAFARGRGRVHVRVGSAQLQCRAQEELSEPVVYLFGSGTGARRPSWRITEAGFDLAPYVQDRARYHDIVQHQGSVFVAQVAFCECGDPEPRLRPWVYEVRHLWGAIGFGNPCANAVQGARWVESCDYARFPILRSGDMSLLCGLYRDRHRLALDPGAWTSTLVRLALPYARHRVVVVAPDGYLLPPEIGFEARSRELQVEIVPTSFFSADRLAAIRKQYLVFSKNDNGLDFPEGIEAVLGQTSRAHIEILPSWMRAQLQPSRKTLRAP
jgi:hypothetical protein